MGRDDKQKGIRGRFTFGSGKKEVRKEEKTEEALEAAPQPAKPWYPFVPKTTMSDDPAPSYEYAQATRQTQAIEQRKNETDSRIENIDGADFKKHFRQLKVPPHETTYADHLDPRKKEKQENGTLDVVYRTETSVTQTSTNEFESAEINQATPQGEKIEKCAVEDPRERDIYENEAQNPEEDLSSISVSTAQDFSDWITKITPSDSKTADPFETVEPAQLGFVKYLFDKALFEIKKGDNKAAGPYIERLGSIRNTEMVIGELQYEIYGRIIHRQVLALKSKAGIDSSLKLINNELKDPKLLRYKLWMQREIVDYLRGVAAQHIHNSDYKSAFQTISDLRTHEKSWRSSDSSSIDNLMGIAGNHIQTKAIAHIEVDEIKEALALLYLLQDNHTLHKRSICMKAVRKYLKDAYERVQKKELHLVWLCLIRVDMIIEIPELWPGVIPTNIDLTKRIFSDPVDNLDTRHDTINKAYENRDLIDQDILDSRNSILNRIRDIYEHQILQELDQLNFNSAYQSMLNLEQFWDESPKPSGPDQKPLPEFTGARAKIEPTEDMIILRLFIFSRQRNFKIRPYRRRVAKVKNQDSPPGTPPYGATLDFVYFLAHAEISYFENRDLEAAIVWCHKAIEISDKTIPRWTSKSDAYFLLGRIFTRKNMPLDADYYYSLIPSFEKYDQWRIYGAPGRALKEADVKAELDRGKLSLNCDSIQNLLRISTLSDTGRSINKSRRQALTLTSESCEAIIRGIYADDISWSSERIVWRHPYRAQTGLAGRFLHFLSMVGPLQYLQIALHNPWVDLEERDEDGRTPLHSAAGAFDKAKASLLIDCGADILAVDNDGNNALHHMLGFAPGVRFSGANIKGTLGLFVGAVVHSGDKYGNPINKYLLLEPNTAGFTPIDLMKSSLEAEMRVNESKTELGYLTRFKEAFEVIRQLLFVPVSYRNDSIFLKPAERERNLQIAVEQAKREADIARTASLAAKMAEDAKALDRRHAESALRRNTSGTPTSMDSGKSKEKRGGLLSWIRG